jgi:hypothetical protein
MPKSGDGCDELLEVSLVILLSSISLHDFRITPIEDGRGAA